MKRLWYILPLLVVAVVILFGLHPYLSMHEPVNKGVLVVEGWLNEDQLRNVAYRFNNGAYDGIVTTGTIRPFTYYLHNKDRMSIGSASVARTARLDASGTEGTHLAFIQGTDTVADFPMVPQVREYRFEVPAGTEPLVLSVYSTVPTDWSFRIGFIRSFEIDGLNLHETANDIGWQDYLGKPKIVLPSYAHLARDIIIHSGVEPSEVKAIPTEEISDEGRTYSNARSFGEYARVNGVMHADLLTLGVHARRSYLQYREAAGIEHFGVYNIPDPGCTRSNWYLSREGRYKVSKELGGLFFGTAVNPLIEENE